MIQIIKRALVAIADLRVDVRDEQATDPTSRILKDIAKHLERAEEELVEAMRGAESYYRRRE